MSDFESLKRPFHPQSESQDQKSEKDHQCKKCEKIFKTEADLNIHIKQKHNQGSTQINNTTNIQKTAKNSLLTKQNQMEDTLYVYLGELGQATIQPSLLKSTIDILDDPKGNGQTNYSLNQVVRTPYELELDIKKQMPFKLIQESPEKQFLELLCQETMELDQVIDSQKQKWELRDPMAPEEEIQNEFSLLNIPKLVQNFNNRKISIKHPQFAIFLLWLSRISKPAAWKEFFIIIGSFLALYHKENGETQKKQSLQAFLLRFQLKSDYAFLKNNKICNEAQGKKLIQHYLKWSQVFSVKK